MKNKNIIEKTDYAIEDNDSNTDRRGRLNRAFAFWSFFVFASLLVFIGGVLVFTRDSPGSGINASSDGYFKDCSLLEENCRDISCTFYNSCNGTQKECKIYDCGDAYGVLIKNADDKIEVKKEAKPDADAIRTEEENCKGDMQILEQSCIDHRFQAKVKLITKGECNIGAFVLSLQEYGNVQNEFESLGDGSYVITTDRCGKAMKIGPVTKSGMYLEF